MKLVLNLKIVQIPIVFFFISNPIILNLINLLVNKIDFLKIWISINNLLIFTYYKLYFG